MAQFQTLKVSSGTEQMPGIGDGQSLKEIASTFTFATAPAAGDTVLSGLIQSGSVITSVKVYNTTGASITAGITGTLNYFITTSAATIQTINNPQQPYVMPSNGNVILTLSGTPTAGFITIFVSFLPRNA